MIEEPAGGSLAEQAASWVPPWARTPVGPRKETPLVVDAEPATDADDDGATVTGTARSPEADEAAMAAGAAVAEHDLRHEFPPEPDPDAGDGSAPTVADETAAGSGTVEMVADETAAGSGTVEMVADETAAGSGTGTGTGTIVAGAEPDPGGSPRWGEDGYLGSELGAD